MINTIRAINLGVSSGFLKPKAQLQKLKFLLPAILGTTIEYYDYALYSFCATIFAQEFFPGNDPTLALLKTFGIFVAGFLAKPIGAILFGHIGDKWGRRIALKISIIGIAIPTTCIGLLPTYHQIGNWAAFLLLICRILQGLFLSGESDGVRIFIFESVGKKYPNFANSLNNVAGMLGYYFASLMANYVLSNDSNDFPSWTWRIAFLLSGILGLFLYWYRCSIQESLEFSEFLNTNTISSSSSSKNGFRSLIRILLKNKKSLVSIILLFGAVGGGYHFYFTFLMNYLNNTLSLVTLPEASLFATKMVLAYTIFGLISGIIADRFGAARVFKTAAKVLMVLTLLNAWMIYNQDFSEWIILTTASILPFFHAPGFILLIEKLKIDERYRCISFGHSMGSMIFSGSAPLIGLWIWQMTGVSFLPFVYFMFLVLMGYFALKND